MSKLKLIICAATIRDRRKQLAKIKSSNYLHKYRYCLTHNKVIFSQENCEGKYAPQCKMVGYWKTRAEIEAWVAKLNAEKDQNND